jgi:hypothetical protein
VGRRWLGVLAVVAVLAAVIAAVALSRGGGNAPRTPAPGRAQPSRQSGDDADLMRRLQRQKIVKRSQ